MQLKKPGCLTPIWGPDCDLPNPNFFSLITFLTFSHYTSSTFVYLSHSCIFMSHYLYYKYTTFLHRKDSQHHLNLKPASLYSACKGKIFVKQEEGQMEWSSSNPIPFIPRPAQSSFAFLYNYNTDPYLYPPGGAEMKHQMMQQASLPTMMDINGLDYDSNNQDKKKRLTCEQLEALENSFQEEIKLDPDRKMKLAHELGLQPRQIAVWFQNRRARWKAKQLERLYDALKQEFDAVFQEKQKLQDEVLALRTILNEHSSKRQAAVSTTGYTDMTGEETTVESRSVATIRSSNNHSHQAVAGPASAVPTVDCNYMLHYDGAAIPTQPYCNWTVLPSYQ